MRQRVTVDILYPFDELSAEAQDKAVEKLWDINVSDSYWHEYIQEDIARFGTVSGLGCQYGGEFELDRRSYIHIDSVSCLFSEILANHGKALAECPDVGQDVITPFLQSFTAQETRHLLTLERYGFLCTLSGQTSTYQQGIRSGVESYYRSQCKRITRLILRVEQGFETLLRDLEHSYVTSLREEYEYQTSREQIIESIRANEYEFYENGTLA